MSRKYLQYNLLVMFLMVCKPSFAMYGAFFKAARAVGVATLPTYGLYQANKADKDTQEYCESLSSISETNIESWGREKMKKLNVPNTDSISFVNGVGWATAKNQIMVPLFGLKLDRALERKNLPVKAFFRDPIRFFLDSPDQTIARNSMILKHELGHIVNNDYQNRIYSIAAIPVAVEAASFSATTAFRKLYNIKPPKTFVKTALGSCIALGAVGPKALAGKVLYPLFARYQETRADKFACENAESRLELEEFADFFRKNENPDWANKNRSEIRLLELFKDPVHPAPVDRKEMAESYIAKWDREHPMSEKRA